MLRCFSCGSRATAVHSGPREAAPSHGRGANRLPRVSPTAPRACGRERDSDDMHAVEVQGLCACSCVANMSGLCVLGSRSVAAECMLSMHEPPPSPPLLASCMRHTIDASSRSEIAVSCARDVVRRSVAALLSATVDNRRRRRPLTAPSAPSRLCSAVVGWQHFSPCHDTTISSSCGPAIYVLLQTKREKGPTASNYKSSHVPSHGAASPSRKCSRWPVALLHSIFIQVPFVHVYAACGSLQQGRVHSVQREHWIIQPPHSPLNLQATACYSLSGPGFLSVPKKAVLCILSGVS